MFYFQKEKKRKSDKLVSAETFDGGLQRKATTKLSERILQEI